MIPWSINNLLGATPLRETDPASPSSYPATVLSQFEVALCAQLSPSFCNFVSMVWMQSLYVLTIFLHLFQDNS